jgi:hypothetical protein
MMKYVSEKSTVTISLLTGTYKDGDGKYVRYPSQQLNQY